MSRPPGVRTPRHSRSRRSGIAVGDAIATRVLDLRATDGATEAIAAPYVPCDEPGDWTPTPPATSGRRSTLAGALSARSCSSADRSSGPAPRQASTARDTRATSTRSTAIRRADADGNPATDADPAWTPLPCLRPRIVLRVGRGHPPGRRAGCPPAGFGIRHRGLVSVTLVGRPSRLNSPPCRLGWCREGSVRAEPEWRRPSRAASCRSRPVRGRPAPFRPGSFRAGCVRRADPGDARDRLFPWPFPQPCCLSGRPAPLRPSCRFGRRRRGVEWIQGVYRHHTLRDPHRMTPYDMPMSRRAPDAALKAG